MDTGGIGGEREAQEEDVMLFCFVSLELYILFLILNFWWSSNTMLFFFFPPFVQFYILVSP